MRDIITSEASLASFVSDHTLFFDEVKIELDADDALLNLDIV